MLLLTLAAMLDETPVYQSVITAITTVLTETALSQILIYAIGIAIVFVLFWFSVRKVFSIVWRAFRKGKLRL